MSEPPCENQPLEGEFSFRRRTADEVTGIHLERQRLLGEARAAQEPWLAKQAGMALARHEVGQVKRPTKPGAPADPADHLLPQEREAHDLSKLALERELIRGRRLEDEVLAIQDKERARLARDLHDGIAQSLVAVTLLLEMHLRQLEEWGPDSKPMQSGQKAHDILAGTLQEMRGLSHGLSGLETGARGQELCDELHTLAARLTTSGTVHCVVVCPEVPTLGEAHATHLYRIVQEAVSQAVRHGKAKHVEIGLVRGKEQWRLTVTDDGTGVPENRALDGGSLEMRSMQYRAAVIGGTLEVRRANASEDRPGAVISCTFP